MLAFDYQDRSLDINDLGFLSRNDMIGGRYALWLSRSNLGGLRRLSVNAAVGRYVNDAGQVVQAGAFIGNSFTFHNRNQLRAMVNYFTPQWEDLESRGNGAFKVRPRAVMNVSYGTDSSKAFAWSVQVNWMQEDVKDAMRSLTAGFTYKPMDRFSLDFDLTRTDRNAWLLWQGGRDLQFRRLAAASGDGPLPDGPTAAAPYHAVGRYSRRGARVLAHPARRRGTPGAG